MNPTRAFRTCIAGLMLVAAGCASASDAASGPTSTSTSTTASTSRPSSHPAGTNAEGVNPLTGAGRGVNVYAHTGAGMLSPAVQGVPTRVYVPNSLSNTVDVIDPTTLRVVDSYPVGMTPQHVVPSYDLETLYVNDNRGNSLTPIDPMTGRAGAPIPVDDPYNLYFTPDGKRAIVMAERNSRVDFRDPKTFELVKSVPIAHAGINHADFTPNGKVMIASCEFSGWIVRIDVTTMTVTGEVHVGGMPVDVKSSPDGTVMFVANQGRGGVSIVDPATMREVGFIATGSGAHGLSVSRDGTQLYVTNRKAGSISVIDFASRRVVATWLVGGSPDMGGVSADGKQFWVSGRYNRAVYVIDTASGKLAATIPVGNGPHGLALFPQPGRFSMGHTGNYR